MVAVAKKKQIDPDFGPRLRFLREAAGMSQELLADRSGLSANSLARIERSEREPGWGTVLKLAAALGVEPNDFLHQSG